MITRYSAWMDGKALHDISPSIYVMDIEESTPVVNVFTAPKGMGDGMIVSSHKRQGLTVTIRVMVHEYDTVKRKEILQRIAAWATKGKYLAISDRPGQRLRVHCYNPPVTPSALKWTNTMSVVFTAYEMPYWEDAKPKEVTLSGLTGSGKIRPIGTVESTPVEVTISGNRSTLTKLSLTVGDTKFVFQNLYTAAGGEIRLYYDENGLLRIPSGSRTPESSDELIAKCGEDNVVSFTANTAVTVTFYARGRYV